MSRDSDRCQALIPFLRYDDATAAIDWLCQAFGFAQHLVVPGPDDAIAHAQLRCGDSFLMLGSAREDSLGLKTVRQLGAGSQGIYVVVADAAAHYAQAKAAGARIVMELTEQDYGSTDYSALDPEGNLWSFGTYHPADDAPES